MRATVVVLGILLLGGMIVPALAVDARATPPQGPPTPLGPGAGNVTPPAGTATVHLNPTPLPTPPFVVVHDFPAQAQGQVLYGLTKPLGVDNAGRVYGLVGDSPQQPASLWRLTPGQNEADFGKFETLHVFAPGTAPLSNFAFDPSGNVFGTVQHQGAFGAGYIYRIGPGGDFHVTHDFHGLPAKDSFAPWLMRDPSGDLWAVNNGLLKMDPSATNVTVRATLPYPLASGLSLTRTASGTIFANAGWGNCGAQGNGPTDTGGGVAELQPGQPQMNCLFSTGSLDASTLQPLELTGNDSFLGSTTGGAAFQGGPSAQGRIYEWSRAGGLKVLHVFAPSEGTGSIGQLIRWWDGSYFGMTDAGVFNVQRTGVFHLSHKLSGPAEGIGVTGFTISGNYLYGATAAGGAHGGGVIFRFKLN